MGFFKGIKSIFGFGGKQPIKPQAPPRGKPAPRGGGSATFTPVGQATFEPVKPTFKPRAFDFGDLDKKLGQQRRSAQENAQQKIRDIENLDLRTPGELEEEELSVQELLEKEGHAAAEAAFLSGQVHYVISSNVHYFQYLYVFPDGAPQNQLVVGFLDGSAYLYEDVSPDEALIFYRAGSPGGAVWDHLRERGTVFGYKKEYRLIEGNRVWHAAGEASQARHEAIPKSGEAFKGYHPSLNFKGAKGKMGQKDAKLDMNAKGQSIGSKKVSYFTPTNAKPGMGDRP